MEIRARGDMVFDLKELQKQKAREEGPVCTWTLFDGTPGEASPEKPILILRKADDHGDNDEAPDNGHADAGFSHHIRGIFMDPARRTGFSRTDGEAPEQADIVRLDSRFVQLIRWLGENQTVVRLSGKEMEEGYAVYRIRAVNYSGTAPSGADAFLQFTIDRLLKSEDAVWDNEDNTADDSDYEQMQVRLTDIDGMTDFLDCAGATLPPNVRRWARRNLSLIKSGAISADEKRHAQRSLSMMLNIEWKNSYFESIDPVEAKKILDEELYGMEDVKQRIIETIIQINRTHTLPAYGLLLVGPAGVGKSQLAYAVARILKLPWASFDMSAINDPEELTGSPRVYANAKPGLIMEAFSRANTSNVVFIINELDKADEGKGAGSPADALLTLLDNLGYTDNYIECMIPTGGVYPIATANDKEKISAPLLSRFAVIEIPDYTPEEKKVIFLRYALPKVLKRMGMKPEECIVPSDAADVVIEGCEGTTGCRDLEQAAERLAANALYQIETGRTDTGKVFSSEEVRKLIH